MAGRGLPSNLATPKSSGDIRKVRYVFGEVTAGRTGRNPRTGESIAIGRSTTVSFKASKALKEALN